MKTNVFKAVAALSEFFTYNCTPEEITAILAQVSCQNERDTQIIAAMQQTMKQALGK